MKYLFKTIEEIKKNISIDVSSDWDTIQPYIGQAEQEIKDIIGRELYKDLLTVVHEDNDNENLKELLEYVQQPLANEIYFISVPLISVNVGDTGITVTSTQSLIPASDKKVENFMSALRKSADYGLEELLIYLEENKKHFPKWKLSKAYSYHKELFVNNTDEFYNATKIEISRLKFIKLKPFIFKCENSEIVPAICNGLFNELKQEINADNISDANIKLLNLIRPIVCYSALVEFDREKYRMFEHEKVRRIELMRNFLEENVDSYFKYKDSNCYEGSSEYNNVNKEDAGTFVFGG